MSLDKRIGVRVISLLIHPIQNSGNFSGAQSHIILQPLTKIGIADLLRIGTAHRSDIVGIAHTRFHKIHIAVIGKIPIMHQAQGQPQHIFDNVPAEDPLIF